MTFRRRNVVGVAIGVVLLGLVVLLAAERSSPDGLYVADVRLGAAGDYYYEFRGGKVDLVVCEDATSTSRLSEGVYSRGADGWVWAWDRGKHKEPVVKLRPSLAGLRVSFPDGSHFFLRRRLFTGRRPDWMQDHLPWGVQ